MGNECGKMLIFFVFYANFISKLAQQNKKVMSKERLFVEQRLEDDFAVRKGNSLRASAVLSTQAEAIERARELNPYTEPMVQRVRNTDFGSRGKWRKP